MHISRIKISTLLPHNILLTPSNRLFSFQVRITLEEEFMPVLNPAQGYDSKRETSMVGLENLGATCYLNALLQVRTDIHTCYLLMSKVCKIHSIPLATQQLRTTCKITACCLIVISVTYLVCFLEWPFYRAVLLLFYCCSIAVFLR